MSHAVQATASASQHRQHMCWTPDVCCNTAWFSTACAACLPACVPACLPACLQAINRGAEVIECQNAQVDLDKILGITAFSLDKLLEADPDFLVSEGE